MKRERVQIKRQQPLYMFSVFVIFASDYAWHVA